MNTMIEPNMMVGALAGEVEDMVNEIELLKMNNTVMADALQVVLNEFEPTTHYQERLLLEIKRIIDNAYTTPTK